MPQDKNSTVINTKGAAGYLGLRPATLEAWRCRGAGPVFLKLGKAVRYRQSDLDKFLEDKARRSTSEGDELPEG